MLSILQKNSKPSQTWRLEDDGPTRSWVQRLDRRLIKDSAFRGCRLFSEATQCDLQLRMHHLGRCVVRHTYTSLQATYRTERVYAMPNCARKVQVVRKRQALPGMLFRSGLELQNKTCRILLHCQPSSLALEVSRWPLLRRQTTS